MATLPSSLNKGCWPPATSMMARRRWPRPIPGATWKPLPSGPRWAMRSVMRRRSSASVGRRPVLSMIPAIPHMRGAFRERLAADDGSERRAERRQMPGEIRQAGVVRRGIAVDIRREADEGGFAWAAEQLGLGLQQLRLDEIGLEAIGDPIDPKHHPPLAIGQGNLRRGDRHALAADRQHDSGAPENVALFAEKRIRRADQLLAVGLP